MDTINPNKKYIKEVYSVFNDIKNKLYEQKKKLIIHIKKIIKNHVIIDLVII